ncbi:N-alpha-acetyl-L-2,4-diaminobutyric acid deacetylase [Halioglobus japonicus]|nr:N-alpha-acetyl-L-2,4-diaminobutyric acid deacetylase [Halioglobus japonicus]
MRQHQLPGLCTQLLLLTFLALPPLATADVSEKAQPQATLEQQTQSESVQAKRAATAVEKKAKQKKSGKAQPKATSDSVQTEDTPPAGEPKERTPTAPAAAEALQPITVPVLERLTTQGASDAQPETKAKTKTNTKDKPGKTKPMLNILGTQVAPGESHRLLWVAGETSYGSKLEAPVYVIRGKHSGPTLCLTAAIHGDELNGVEIIRRLVTDLSPNKLYGTVIGVPIVNLLGFTRGTRYLPDRRDLNRYFPGNPNGSSASRIAFSFFEHIVRHCDLLIDLHTGSLTRTNMPQVRANLQIPEVLEFTTKFGSTAVLHSRKLRGNLRSAATNYGIPAVALELGEPGSLQQEHVDDGVEIIENVLSGLDMTRRLWTVGGSQPVFYSSRWVRVNTGGLLISEVEVGERIWEGDVLGSMVNPITNESVDVISPHSGRVLGMALNQFMLPGYAAFNIGIVADEKEAVDDAQSFECINTDEDANQETDDMGCVPDEGEELEQEGMDIGVYEDEEGP